MPKKYKIIAFGCLALAVLITGSIFVYIPAYFLQKITKIENNSLVYLFIKQLLILLLILSIPFYLKKIKHSSLLIFILSHLTALYYTFVYFIIAYWWYTKSIFNPYFFIDSYTAILDTAKYLFGLPLTVIFIICLLLVYFFYYLYFALILNDLTKIKVPLINFKYTRYWLIIPLMAVTVIQPSGYLSYHYKLLKEVKEARNYFQPYIPDFSSFQTNSTTNIFILQTESGNSLALQGKSNLGEKYKNNFIPHFTKIAQDGIFIPQFWGNSVQTDRAQENILCGITHNIGTGFNMKPEQLQNACLPSILEKSGYTTIAFRSDRLEFQNMGKFMSSLGFAEVHYQDIMQANDPKYHWGYDDCVFYKRAFEYLRANYPQKTKLMVYFEVSSHHIPWNLEEKYAFTHSFNPPTNFLEKYIDSAQEQDYCLTDFYQYYNSYSPDNTHLIILADTSWPVGINDGNIFNFQNAFNENFLTYLAYIPPAQNKKNYYIGKKINNQNNYSHTDIPPTIYSLIGTEQYQNSFIFELEKAQTPNNYENCQILSQPYAGGQFVVINGQDKYLYSILEKTLTYYDLQKDFYEKSPQLIQNGLSFPDFQKQYFCPRYKK